MKVELEIHADGDIYFLKEDGKYHYAGCLCSEDDNETAQKAEAWLLDKRAKNDYMKDITIRICIMSLMIFLSFIGALFLAIR